MSKQRPERRISESGEDLCNVCHEVTQIFAVGECDHPVCYRCSTRMRVLCDQMYCAICRADLPKVAFTKTFTKFADLDLVKFKLHQKHKIFFENEAVKSAYFEIQEHRCTACPSRKILYTFHQLVDHMRKEHSLFPCQLCILHIKVFSSERKFYDRRRLGEHRRIGDSEDTSHKGHPLCKFCDERYFDNDELVRHLRKDHYYCHFCDADGISNAFYSEYGNLRDHFLDEHYLCEEGECASIQFTNAFRHDLDYKAHMALMHSKNFSKGMAKAVRTLDIDITLKPREYQGGRGRGRRPQGVVSRQDYEEVASQEGAQVSGPPGMQGRGKDFKRERRQHKVESDDFQRAITASLNTAPSVNVVDPAILKYNQKSDNTMYEDAPQRDTKYSRRSEDFPTLGGNAFPSSEEAKSASSDSDSEYVTRESESLCKKVARAKGFSVQHGGMGEKDFPTLGGVVNSLKPQGSSALQGSKPKTHIKNANGWTIHDDDEPFPDLGGSGTESKGGGVTPGNIPPATTWTDKAKKYAPAPQASNWVVGSTVNATSNKNYNRSVNNKSSSDFPSLSSIGENLKKGSATETLSQYPTAPGISSARSNVRIIENKPNDSPPSVRAYKQGVTANQDRNNKDDFPSLGKSKKNSAPQPSGTKNKSSESSWAAKSKPVVPTKHMEAQSSNVLKIKNEGDGMLKLKMKNKKKSEVSSSEWVSEDSTDSVKSNKSNSGSFLVKTNTNEKSATGSNERVSSGTKSANLAKAVKKAKGRIVVEDVQEEMRINNVEESSSSLNNIGDFLSKGASTGSASNAMEQYASQYGVSTHKQTSNVKVVEAKLDLVTMPHQKKAASSGKKFNKETDFPSFGGGGVDAVPVPTSWGAKSKMSGVEGSDSGTKKENEEDMGMLKLKTKSKKKKSGKNNSNESSSDSVKMDNSGKLSETLGSKNEDSFSNVDGEYDSSSGKITNKKSKKSKGKAATANSSQSNTQSDDNKCNTKATVPKNIVKSTINQKEVLQSVENNSLTGTLSAFPSIHVSDNEDDNSSDNSDAFIKKVRRKQKQKAVNINNDEEFPSLGGKKSGKSSASVSKKSGKSSASVSEGSKKSGKSSASVSEESKKSGKSSASVSEESKKSGKSSASVSEESKKSGKSSASVSEESKKSGKSSASVSEGSKKAGKSSDKSMPAAPPPPGFSNAKMTPPPGFVNKESTPVEKSSGSNSSVVKPPPGFSSGNNSSGSVSTAKSGLSDIASLLANNNGTSVSDVDCVIDNPSDDFEDNQSSYIHQSEPIVYYEYIKPVEFQERNHKLINDIVNLLESEQEKFMIFKTISGEFRQGSISAFDYYLTCSEIIGAKKFDKIFPELLVLLPDITKQQQLLNTYNSQQQQQKRKIWDKSSTSLFAVCQVCEQVVSPSELSTHLSEHNLESDFPLLGKSTSKAGVAGMGNWGITAK